MSATPTSHHTWEYRRLHLMPHQEGDGRIRWQHDAPGFIDNLLTTVQELAGAAEQGWRLVSVKVEEDDSGHCRLNACMKRPKTGVRGQPAGAFPATIAFPRETTASSVELPTMPPDPGIEKAA